MFVKDLVEEIRGGVETLISSYNKKTHNNSIDLEVVNGDKLKPFFNIKLEKFVPL